MSSLKDLASLIMVPSLYKDGELHTVKPLADEDVILHPDATGNHDGNDGSTDRNAANFTFSRGSNLAATRVDVNGLIEKGRENRLLQSNTFSNATWSKSLASVTGGQAGYDGTNDAWLFTSTGNFARIQQSAGPTGVLTLSAYVKAGTTDWVMLRIAGSGYNVTQYFDLQNGVVGSISGVSAKITSVGGGWYRCEATANASASASSYIYSALGDGNLSVTNETIYIQDAQLEAGLVATDYIETTSSTAQAGILEDMPRLDYSGGASCPALLLEPQRSNISTHSEYFDGWVKQYVSNTANITTSPEGLVNAYTITDTTDNFRHINYLNLNGDLSISRTFSIYAKQNTLRYLFLSVTGSADVHCYSAIFDLQEGQVTGTKTNGNGTLTESIEDAGNGWYRCIISGTMTSGTGNYFPLIGTSDSPDFTGTLFNDNAPSYAGDGSSIYIYGAQLEAGSYPTSYIPTYGASVTRSLDSAATPDLTANGVATNPNAWTFIVKGDWLGNGVPANNHTFSRQEGGFMYRYGGSMGFSGATKTYWTEYNPTAATAYIWDGTQLRIRRGGSDIKTISADAIGWNSGGITNWSLTYVNIRNIQYEVDQVILFNSVLTNSEIDALTTL